MKTIYTKDVPPRTSEDLKVDKDTQPATNHISNSVMEKSKLLPKIQKPFAQKRKFITENQKDDNYQHSIDHLEKRIKQLERQVKLLLARDGRHDKAHNYLKERVATVTNKVTTLTTKLDSFKKR